jgi:SHS family lactate transporter-like MFS transporter
MANLGAIAGGTVIGYASQIFGRRFSIIFICVVGGALLYPYTFTSTTAVIAAAFFEQFCVQGAWGVIPIHLMELSPGSFHTFVVGTAYQLGNLASAASSTIESTLGDRFPLPPEGKAPQYKYGLVVCIFMGCAYAYVILLTFLGPEYLKRSFDVREDSDLGEAAGHETIEAALQRARGGERESDPEDVGEKVAASHV